MIIVSHKLISFRAEERGGNGVLRGGRASRVAREGDVRGGKREGASGMPAEDDGGGGSSGLACKTEGGTSREFYVTTMVFKINQF